MATQIYDLLSIDTVAVGLSGRDKDSILSQLVDLLAGHGAVTDLDAVRLAVTERERMMSTGVGSGLAFPHAKTSAVSSTVAALATTREPVEFDALDSLPVRILFLLVGPSESKSEHIRILSRISRMMNRKEFREALLAAVSGDEILAIVKNNESLLASLS